MFPWAELFAAVHPGAAFRPEPRKLLAAVHRALEFAALRMICPGEHIVDRVPRTQAPLVAPQYPATAPNVVQIWPAVR